MSTEKTNYRCSQGDLYSVSETGWENYKKYQARFTAYKGKYTATTRTDALAAISAAKALPDDDARSAVAALLHVDVEKAGKVCLGNFQFLLGYIDEIWKDKVSRDVQYVAAGQRRYAAAANNDWEAMDSMNTSAKNFITANTTVLLGVAPNLNMPATFPATFNTGVTDFVTKYGAFKTASETGTLTGAKIKANNDCHDALTAMFADAQKIFLNEPDIARMFQFSYLLSLINQKIVGMRGTVKETGTNKPIGGAQISAQKVGEVAVVFVTEADGSYSKILSAGMFVVTVTAANYVSQTVDVELVDTMKGVDFEMVVV